MTQFSSRERRTSIRRAALCLVITACALATAWTVPQAAGPQQAASGTAQAPAARHAAVVNQYCVTCHNDRLKSADLSLEGVALENVASNAELWEKVVRKLQRGAMPPQGVKRPEPAALDGLTAYLEGELDRAALAKPNPGEPLVHRLNRTEYGNAIRDLLALDLDVSSLLPPDDSAYGFDNISDVLGLSPVLIERYVSAAEGVSALAIGEPDVSLGSSTYLMRQDRSQNVHIEGLPLGTVGGLAVNHIFPVNAEYEFQILLLRTNTDGLIGLERVHELEISIDGQRVFLDAIGGERDNPRRPARRERGADDADDETGPPVEARLKVRVPVPAGPHTVSAAWVQRRGADTNRLQSFVRTTSSPYDSTGQPHIRTMTIVGPYNATGPGDTPSRQRIFVCTPETPKAEVPCARQILSTLARRAYRRPTTEDDMRPLMAFFESGRKEGTFEMGIQRALQRLLASPRFLLRMERNPATGPATAGTLYRLSDLEVASRLSFFIWSSIPDDELLDLATKGRLTSRPVLEQQVKRMLADPKAAALSTSFAGQWLQLRNLKNTVPDPEQFPDFDDQLREAFARETELFFASIVREDRNVLDLLTADYTFVNERLARHYGIPHVKGSHFRRVPVSDPARRGLLGQGSVLTVTSHPDRTAPVMRGKWILDNLVGTPPPPPPPNVPDLSAVEDGGKPKTIRQMMEAHRANAVCASCHKLMDPLGLALEHFDAVGAARTKDHGLPIDASSTLYDGTPVDGAVSMREGLMKRPDVLVSTLTEKLLTYALGRGPQPYDMPVVRSIVRDAGRHEYRFSALVIGIVESTPFQKRAAEGPEVSRANRSVARR
jgi:mono/diheme cytochrome c family protein